MFCHIQQVFGLTYSRIGHKLKKKKKKKKERKKEIASCKFPSLHSLGNCKHSIVKKFHKNLILKLSIATFKVCELCMKTDSKRIVTLLHIFIQYCSLFLFAWQLKCPLPVLASGCNIKYV